MLKIAYTMQGMIIGSALDPNKNGGMVFKNPRIIQTKPNESGGINFNIAELLGGPDFLEIPPGSIIGNVTDKTVEKAYRERVTGLVLPGSVISKN